MAGFLFNLAKDTPVEEVLSSGMYATIMSAPSGFWSTAAEATFGDYLLVRPKDRVFFFQERRIYGIGEIVSIGGLPAANNYPGADRPSPMRHSEVRDVALTYSARNAGNQRWVCFFRPSPYFFRTGVDMDDMLSRHPARFRMLRAFWKRSFIRMDDEETQAMVDVVLGENEDGLTGDPSKIFSDQHRKNHATAERLIESDRDAYVLNPSRVLSAALDGPRVKHEMALEAALLGALQREAPAALRAFGRWDYITHQMVASPFKPIDYMDRMDLFGYRCIRGYPTTRSKFFLAEVKKDAATEADVDQVLRYVDWVRGEYSGGDYSKIDAFLVAQSFSPSVIKHAVANRTRSYTKGSHPAVSRHWSSLKLIAYSIGEDLQLDFAESLA